MHRIPVIAALLVVLAACGRSPLPATQDGENGQDLQVIPGLEVVVSDTTPPPQDIGVPVADGPCFPGCVARCKMVVDCNLYPAGPAQCLADCPNWSDPIKSCLDGLICAGATDCQAVQACITSPPVADLVVKDFNASAKNSTVSYSLKVCNGGKATAGPFDVALYYDRKTAPKPKQPGDKVLPVAGGLQLGDCAPLSFQRKNTPDGTYSSWAQVDVKGTVPEIDEGNNVAGPVSVTASTPPMADLVIKKLDATLKGADLVFELQVCNVGTAHAWLVRADIYYSQLLKPTNFLTGDQSVTFFTGLGPGACKTATRTYKKVPVGIYRSWAQVDTLNTVKESNEGNNVAGPKLTTVSPQSGCVGLCTFAIGCGMFTIGELGQCLTWCNGLTPSERNCADKADSANSCSDLKSCNLPPLPPAPPPPWACLQICNYLANTCNLVPSNQYLTCVGGCISLPQTKVQCALNAMNNKQCLPMMLCIL